MITRVTTTTTGTIIIVKLSVVAFLIITSDVSSIITVTVIIHVVLVVTPAIMRIEGGLPSSMVMLMLTMMVPMIIGWVSIVVAAAIDRVVMTRVTTLATPGRLRHQ